MTTRARELLPGVSDDSQVPETPRKKARRGDYQSYGGFRRRHCICSYGDECTAAWKSFVDAKDNRRCGYFYVRSSTSVMASVKHREVIYAHLFPKRVKDKPPAPQGHDEYVAYHHFDPSILQDNNAGPIKEVTAEQATPIGLQRSDQHPGKHIYFPAPNYPYHCWD